MLNIYFGDMEKAMYDPPVYFDNEYDDEWITRDIVKKIIKDIDKSDVISADCIQSPVLGQIPPLDLSGGAKTLILMCCDDSNIYNATMCGDNCAKWILEIAKTKDLTINLRHIMDFGKDNEFEIKILNSGVIVHNMKEYLKEAFKYDI